MVDPKPDTSWIGRLRRIETALKDVEDIDNQLYPELSDKLHDFHETLNAAASSDFLENDKGRLAAIKRQTTRLQQLASELLTIPKALKYENTESFSPKYLSEMISKLDTKRNRDFLIKEGIISQADQEGSHEFMRKRGEYILTGNSEEFCSLGRIPIMRAKLVSNILASSVGIGLGIEIPPEAELEFFSEPSGLRIKINGGSTLTMDKKLFDKVFSGVPLLLYDVEVLVKSE